MLIPPNDKPGTMPIERCEELQRLLGNTMSFIKKNEGRAARESRTMGTDADEIAAMSLDELRDEVMRLRTQSGGTQVAASGADGESRPGRWYRMLCLTR